MMKEGNDEILPQKMTEKDDIPSDEEDDDDPIPSQEIPSDNVILFEDQEDVELFQQTEESLTVKYTCPRRVEILCCLR